MGLLKKIAKFGIIYFMDNLIRMGKKWPSLIIILSLLILTLLPLYAQGSNTQEADFQWEPTEGGRYIRIIGYLGRQREISIPSQINAIAITEIGKDAFSKNRLTGVNFPASITHIGNNAFFNNGLRGMVLPNGLIQIGENAFANNNLEGITIPNSVIFIGSNAFHKNNLRGLVIPDSVTVIGDNAFSSNKLEGVVISGNVTSIGNSAFRNNRLRGIKIPDSVNSIGELAFTGNKITLIEIGQNVSMGKNAFDNSFMEFYETQGRKTGIYSLINRRWVAE